MRLALFLLFAVHCSFAQNSYTMVFLNKKSTPANRTKEETAELMKGHLANINRLAKEKKLLVAGPFDGGGGIFILNTDSKQMAQEWIGTDPGIQAGAWDI